jgi:hypothetical protein
MECAHQTRRTRGYEYFYYACRHNDPVETGREQRCTARRVRRDELDAVVWDALVSWIQSPQTLVEECCLARESGGGRARDLARIERLQRRTTLQIERLIDAYQRGALGAEELKRRRERLETTCAAARARAEELAAQEMDRERVERLGEDLAAFAATLRSDLGHLDFAGRQHPVRLLVERVIISAEDVSIEHAIPLSGRFAGYDNNVDVLVCPRCVAACP